MHLTSTIITISFLNFDNNSREDGKLTDYSDNSSWTRYYKIFIKVCYL